MHDPECSTVHGTERSTVHALIVFNMQRTRMGRLWLAARLVHACACTWLKECVPLMHVVDGNWWEATKSETLRIHVCTHVCVCVNGC